MSLLTSPETYLGLATLSLMEIVLGIDNLVFLSIVTGKLPPREQSRARRAGLVLALGFRIGLLLMMSWLMGLTKPWFEVLGQPFSGRDLILLAGGVFLIAKATVEIYGTVDERDPHASAHTPGPVRRSFAGALVQIVILDIVFSIDSVVTAVGMARHLAIMIAAMVIAMGVMLVFAKSVGEFIERHPSMKVLALSFLIMIGVVLTAEGLGRHFPHGYVYFAMAFSLGVELLNMRLSQRRAKQSAHSRRR